MTEKQSVNIPNKSFDRLTLSAVSHLRSSTLVLKFTSFSLIVVKVWGSIRIPKINSEAIIVSQK